MLAEGEESLLVSGHGGHTDRAVKRGRGKIGVIVVERHTDYWKTLLMRSIDNILLLGLQTKHADSPITAPVSNDPIFSIEAHPTYTCSLHRHQARIHHLPPQLWCSS